LGIIIVIVYTFICVFIYEIIVSLLEKGNKILFATGAVPPCWSKSAVWGLTGVYPRENGFSIIRILQKDVYYNKYDWLCELCENIETITNENRVQNIYMCRNNEYKDFEICY